MKIKVTGNYRDVANSAWISTVKEIRAMNRTDEDARRVVGFLVEHHHCYHPEMEVLTKSGWKAWLDCKEYETYAVPNIKNKSISFEKLKIENFDYNGKLYCFENNRMSYKVTPNHRMYFKNKYGENKNSFGICRADSVPSNGWYEPGRDYSISENNELNPKKQLLGFYLGDGSYQSKNRISFHIKKERKKKYLRELLNNTGVLYVEKKSTTHKDGIIFWVETPKFLKSYLGSLIESRAGEKSLSEEFILSLNNTDIRSILNGLINSDGSIKKDRVQTEFYSSSPKLINLFETLSTLVIGDGHSSGRNSSNIYTSKRTSLESRAQYKYCEQYDGKVYCTTTSTGLLVVRGRKDKFSFICGNTSPFESVTITLFCKENDDASAYGADLYSRVKGWNCSIDLLNFIKVTVMHDLFDKEPWKLFTKECPELSEMCSKFTPLGGKVVTADVSPLLGNHGMTVELISLHDVGERSLSRATWRVKCPLSIAVQILRHRKGSFNMCSGRYKTIRQEVVPPVDDCAKIFDKIGEDLNRFLGSVDPVILQYNSVMKKAQEAKKQGLISNDEYKRLREFARFVLPEGRMTELYITYYLDDFYDNYVLLRDSTHAQTEHIWIAQELQRTLELAN